MSPRDDIRNAAKGAATEVVGDLLRIGILWLASRPGVWRERRRRRRNERKVAK